MTEPISFIKACQDFFTKEPNGLKISIDEFKKLTHQDRVDLRNELIRQGYNVEELKAPKE